MGRKTTCKWSEISSISRIITPATHACFCSHLQGVLTLLATGSGVKLKEHLLIVVDQHKWNLPFVRFSLVSNTRSLTPKAACTANVLPGWRCRCGRLMLEWTIVTTVCTCQIWSSGVQCSLQQHKQGVQNSTRKPHAWCTENKRERKQIWAPWKVVGPRPAKNQNHHEANKLRLARPWRCQEGCNPLAPNAFFQRGHVHPFSNSSLPWLLDKYVSLGSVTRRV